MNRQSAELVRALTAVASHFPRVVIDLPTGDLPVSKQHEFADLLAELSDLLRDHAEDQARGIIQMGPETWRG
jgi:hypothetical protein